jgi:3-hydroxyisobutyrate dehydrogenase-like beta-hydroxyacid dehydrogenase
MKKAVGVVGLGIMGSAMAANLARAGFAVYGFDVAKKRIPGVKITPLRDLGHNAPVIITSLPSAEALHDTAKKLEGGGVVVETSTLPIDEKEKARKIGELNGVTLLDCPLSGTGAQARTKDLVVYCSGDKSAFTNTIPVLKAFSRAHYYLGEFGNGSRMKFVANLLVAIHNVSAAEAFALGMKAGLPAKVIFDVQANSAGASRMFQVRGPMMVAGRYKDVTMSNALWQKDMKIIGEFAAKLGVPTPLFNASAAIYSAAMSQGYAKEDTAAVCAVMESLAGIRRKR